MHTQRHRLETLKEAGAQEQRRGVERIKKKTQHDIEEKMRVQGERVVGSELKCERKKKGTEAGRKGRREKMHERGKESYAGEQDLRELSRAERSRVILHNDG